VAVFLGHRTEWHYYYTELILEKTVRDEELDWSQSKYFLCLINFNQSIYLGVTHFKLVEFIKAERDGIATAALCLQAGCRPRHPTSSDEALNERLKH